MTQPLAESTEQAKHLYGLVELTLGPWNGDILRTERMTDLDAKRRNTSMTGTVIEWRKTQL